MPRQFRIILPHYPHHENTHLELVLAREMMGRRVRWGDDWLYVYLLMEFQSTVDPWMVVRIMTYLGLLYHDLIKGKQLTTGGKLSPVFPVVLYNGNHKWMAATDISQLVVDVPGGLSRYRPQLQYLLLAERDYSDVELGELKNLVAALFSLGNSHNPESLAFVPPLPERS